MAIQNVQIKNVMVCRLLVALMFCLSIHIVGCGKMHSGDYTRHQPAAGDLVGVWRVKSSQSVTPVALYPNIGSAALIIHGDNTFEASDYPVAPFDNPYTINYVAGNGRWSIKKAKYRWVIELTWHVRDDEPNGLSEDMYIMNQQSEYLLKDIIGDPDSGYAIVFDREQPVRIGGRNGVKPAL